MNAIHAPNSDVIYPHFLAGNSNIQPSPTMSASNSLSPSSVTTAQSSSTQVVLNLNFHPLLNTEQRASLFLLFAVANLIPRSFWRLCMSVGFVNVIWELFGIRACAYMHFPNRVAQALSCPQAVLFQREAKCEAIHKKDDFLILI